MYIRSQLFTLAMNDGGSICFIMVCVWHYRLYKLDGLIWVKSKTRFDHLSISYNCEIIVRKI